MSINNCREILGIKSTNTKEIKKKYRELSKKYHPDKAATEELKDIATILFQKIGEAYEILTGGPIPTKYCETQWVDDNNKKKSFEELKTQFNKLSEKHHSKLNAEKKKESKENANKAKNEFTEGDDFYKILNIQKKATIPEIKDAYKKIENEHKDNINLKFFDSDNNFKQILIKLFERQTKAYNTLITHNKREYYDKFCNESKKNCDNKKFNELKKEVEEKIKMQLTLPNYYEILNITKDAKASAIKKSYDKIKQEHEANLEKHKGEFYRFNDGFKEQYEKLFKIQTEAYNILSNNDQKKKYDEYCKVNNFDNLNYEKLKQNLIKIKKSEEIRLKAADDKIAKEQEELKILIEESKAKKQAEAKAEAEAKAKAEAEAKAEAKAANDERVKKQEELKILIEESKKDKKDLYNSIETKDLTKITSILDKNSNLINVKDSAKGTLLAHAVVKGAKDVIEFLLNKKAKFAVSDFTSKKDNILEDFMKKLNLSCDNHACKEAFEGNFEHVLPGQACKTSFDDFCIIKE